MYPNNRDADSAKNKDSAFCKELPNADEQLSCEFAITMINAQETNNEKLCDTLKTPTYLKQCKVHVYKQNAIAKMIFLSAKKSRQL